MFLFTSIAVDSHTYTQAKRLQNGSAKLTNKYFVCIRFREMLIEPTTTTGGKNDGNTNHMQITNNHYSLLGIFVFVNSIINGVCVCVLVCMRTNE